MPIRLPSRRRSGPTTKALFRRRTPPTPQATRLMQVSLLSGLLLLVILAVLFVPKALEFGVQPPVVTMAGTEGPDHFTIRVTQVSVKYAFSGYRAEVNVTDASGRPIVDFDVRTLSPGVPQYGGNVTFEDADGDGTLSAGDTFTIRKQPGATTYELNVYHETRDRGAPPPCPCPVGQWRSPPRP